MWGALRVMLTGLSPRMRGNPGHRSRAEGRVGSIPAHAGEPQPIQGPLDHARVYPRACGGTVERDAIRQSREGLSPRMRGNL